MLVVAIAFVLMCAFVGGFSGHVLYVDSFDALDYFWGVIRGALIGAVLGLLLVAFVVWLFSACSVDSSACGADSDTKTFHFFWMIGPKGQFFWGIR